jgi:DNA-binding beta-propeller fold protein YncE
MRRRTLLSLPLAVALAGSACAPRAAPPAAMMEHVAYVVSESADRVARVRFADGRLTVERERGVGPAPSVSGAPHGVAVAPDAGHYYVTLGHGRPFGSLLKLSTATDEVVGETTLGLFPATVDVTPDGVHAFVSNFNLHGDAVPSSVSKVRLETMTEVARTETCAMPHGSRTNPRGTAHYSVCMMSDLAVEIDVASGLVARRFSVAPGREGLARADARPAAVLDLDTDRAEHSPHADGADDAGSTTGQAESCAPTWAQPGHDGRHLYVTCSALAEVLEIDLRDGAVRRRFATGPSPYNAETTRDGRLLLVTLRSRGEPALQVFSLADGRLLARVPTSARLAHGVAATADGRWAFVTSEGVGPEPGWVDVIDLATFERVAGIEVGQQAAGVAVVPPRAR